MFLTIVTKETQKTRHMEFSMAKINISTRFALAFDS